MIKDYFFKILYSFFYIIYIFDKRLLLRKFRPSKWILRCNNKIVLNKLKKIKIGKILIILPHCVQDANCRIRVTNNLENCKRCGKCNLGEAKLLSSLSKNLYIRVATGGTLARRYVKELRPSFVIAVACERDLMSGIFDAFPFPVYGIFNRIVVDECQGTDFSVEEIKKILIDMNLFKEGK